jgi:hypothetical protein
VRDKAVQDYKEAQEAALEQALRDHETALLASWEEARRAQGEKKEMFVPILPAQYTARSWRLYEDAFSYIAAQPWCYGDMTKWRILYEANKLKLPDPSNPDLLPAGLTIDIPSIAGEVREGRYDREDYSSPFDFAKL